MDVKTKLIMSLPSTNRTKEVCTKAILCVKNDYRTKDQIMKSQVFDREPEIVPTEDALKEGGVKLILKSVGQNVGLVE